MTLPERYDPESARRRMVAEHLRARGIAEPRLLAAFQRVPRHRFVLPEDLDRAYGDHPLGIGEGQTISQPYMVATMLEALALTGAERVLEIGTGSGYQTALLLELAREVYTIERLPGLAACARAVLDRLEYTRYTLRVGDGTLGWPEAAPFDRILVSAGSPRVPPSLVAQLAEGGVLAIPVGDASLQELTLVRKLAGGRVTETRGCACMFVRLVGAEGWHAEG
ncbi:MAG: protein-L-isoaspartate(D-aspartate) O-methyltransferase [Planctomycetes bacterium]|nr:protein-L-isoaspartate(D-aspartate) O-methyltransferase [Planctomycetota bacterium]